MKISTHTKVIISIICILTGSLICYFEDYKNLFSIQVTYGVLIFIGWVIILQTFFEDNMFADKRHHSEKYKELTSMQKLLRFFTRLIFGAVVLVNVFSIIKLSDNRVTDILNNYPNQITFATVTGFQERFAGKRGTMHYAVIHYNVNDENITQYIHDSKDEYEINQQIEIKYSLKYHDMFAIY